LVYKNYIINNTNNNTNNNMILITGINGEMGTALVKYLASMQNNKIIGIDIAPAKKNIESLLYKSYVCDITDKKLLNEIFSLNKIRTIYHLAAILSTKAESNPFLSHQVNVNGFLNLINEIKINKKPVKFFFPSSIAVYFLKDSTKAILESEFCLPNNIYGCNKLYCEKLGSYFSKYAQDMPDFDFRSIRFPGIISANTLPQGGTSDYAPEMIHNAIQHKNYVCFVNQKSCIPFMLMPDAINAIIQLMKTEKNNLHQSVYHIQAFNPTVNEIYKELKIFFPEFKLTYNINKKRQMLIDSWPSQLNQKAAENDWKWSAKYNFKTGIKFLIPKIKEFYS
jgi:threonine 3-dehydrogenase